MTWGMVIVLAVVQGIAEFLPISSSGHLAVLGFCFGLDGESNMLFSIVLHAGTLVAIVVYYWPDLWRLLRRKNWRAAGWILLGSVPAGLFGVGLKLAGAGDALFNRPWLVGIGFLATASLLYSLRKSGTDAPVDKSLKLKDLSWRQTLLIGVAQMIAIMPGVSRSGSTIVAGIHSKLPRALAAQYSFMLAIVAIGGAALLEFKDWLLSAKDSGVTLIAWPMLVSGFLISAVVGYLALRWLIDRLNKGNLRGFVIYVLAMAVFTFICEFWIG